MNDRKKDEVIPQQTMTPGRTLAFRPLRVWPAILLALLMLAGRFAPEISEDAMAKYWMISVFGPLLCCLLLLIWWLAASRATWRERLFGFLGIIVGAVVAVTLAHPTMRGPATTYLTVPMGLFLFAIATVFLKRARPVIRTGIAVLLAFAGFAVSMLLRNEGMTGDYKFSWRSRWTQSAEESMLASSAKAPASNIATALDRGSVTNALAHAEWPGFRGVDRAGRCLGPKISTNWSAQPPQQLWKIQVGP